MNKKRYASVIVLKLPDGLHYYCGKIKYQNHFLDEWDKDITYAIIYFSKVTAKKRCAILKQQPAQNRSKVKDFFRLSPTEQQKRIADVNNFHL